MWNFGVGEKEGSKSKQLCNNSLKEITIIIIIIKFQMLEKFEGKRRVIWQWITWSIKCV